MKKKIKLLQILVIEGKKRVGGDVIEVDEDTYKNLKESGIQFEDVKETEKSK